MTSLASSAPLAPSPPRTQALIAGLVLAAFAVFSLWVVAGHGYLGFLTLARDEPWALQMLLDLAIACAVASGWVIGDARRRGLTAWPYVAVTVVGGSIGILAYLVRRGFAPAPAQPDARDPR